MKKTRKRNWPNFTSQHLFIQFSCCIIMVLWVYDKRQNRLLVVLLYIRDLAYISLTKHIYIIPFTDIYVAFNPGKQQVMAVLQSSVSGH